MENQVIYLVEVYRFKVNEETAHYVLNAWTNKEEAIKYALESMEMYRENGYDIHKTEETESDQIGWIDNGETSKFYWINEVEIVR